MISNKINSATTARKGGTTTDFRNPVAGYFFKLYIDTKAKVTSTAFQAGCTEYRGSHKRLERDAAFPITTRYTTIYDDIWIYGFTRWPISGALYWETGAPDKIRVAIS